MSDGALVKLTIVPFDESGTVQAASPAGPPFVAQFNPETFTINNQVSLGPGEPAPGDTGAEAKFLAVEPRTFAFDFLLDGTGVAGGVPREVRGEIELFRTTVGFHGSIHRTRFLVLSWGSFVATCVLESYSVNYKLFRPNGIPLRAVLSATFKEHESRTLGQLVKNLSSPDVTHAHLVKGGEHLSLITHRVYKEPRHYLAVARSNGLDTVRVVEPGTTLQLPPLK